MNRVFNLLQENRWLALIALLSLVLKIGFLLQGGLVNPDAATYIAAAEKHSQGLFKEGLRYYRMPLYPLLLAGVHLVVPTWILAGQLLSIASLWLSLFPLYGITKRLFCRSAALWAACLFAVLPVFNESVMDIKRDPLYLFFVLCALWLLVVFIQENKLRFFFGALTLAALATLTRIEGCLLFFVSPVPLFLTLKNNTISRKKNIVGGILAVATLVAIVYGANSAGISSYLRFNDVSRWLEGFSQFNFFNSYQNLLQAIKDLQKSLPGGKLSNNLLEVTRHYAPLIYCLGLFETLLKAIFPTSVLALWALRWRSQREKKVLVDRWLIVLVWIGFSLLNLLFLLKRNFIQERYFWVPIVLTLPWVGSGISLWWQKRGQKKVLASAVVALIVVAPLVKTMAVASEPQDRALIDAAVWLRHYDPQQKMKVIYNDRRFALYADRVGDVKRIVSTRAITKPEKLKANLKNNDLVVLYLSQEKMKMDFSKNSDVVREFRGESKVVFILSPKISN